MRSIFSGLAIRLSILDSKDRIKTLTESVKPEIGYTAKILFLFGSQTKHANFLQPLKDI